MKTIKTLTTATAALGLATGIAAAQDVDIEDRMYMTGSDGKLYEVTLVEIDEEDMAEHAEDMVDMSEGVTNRAEALGAEASDIDGQDRLVLTERYTTERTEELTTNQVREVETFEDEQMEDEMVDEDTRP
jgi:predicted nucleotidyltransferase